MTHPCKGAAQGFLTTETAKALDFFEEATQCFKKALQEAGLSRSTLMAQPKTTHALSVSQACSICNAGAQQ